MKYLRLAVWLIVGFFGGSLLMNIALYAARFAGHPIWPAWLLPLQVAGEVLGAFSGYLWWRFKNRPLRSDVHGSAHFQGAKITRATLGVSRGLIVGRDRRGELLRYDGPAHLLTIAPTRSGKGVGAIIPNLLTTDYSILCIDPKGENARITARARALRGPVHVLDPFGISGEPCAAFNPLSRLDPAGVDLAEDAAMIADALVYDPPGQVSEAHWNEEARALIAGLILHIVTNRSPAHRSLAAVRALLTTTPEKFDQALFDMQGSYAARGLVARAANRHLSKSEREGAGVLSAAQRHTHFLDSPRMVRVLQKSDFAFSDLKRGPTSVFLVLPPERLATHARWLRLLVVQAIGELAQTQAKDAPPPHPVLMMLDEFAALGRVEPVERAFALMAGYGLQLWAILQDLHQLKGLYGEQAGSFLSNAGLIQVFNVADIDTATWVSRTLGAATEVFNTMSWAERPESRPWWRSYTPTTTLNLSRRDLMTPDEVMRLGQEELLLLRPGMSPVVAQKVRYYRDQQFAGLFDA
ncbi:type IV secretory system conjugative DNA transfer family protein [Phenylobacterium sp.]|uniref:type IV secretory system conjugative DNA transfer family protein n=1 Tax=Phenylobacterium sp. TaxID=1871053 RepID=UPI0030F44BC2